MLSKCVYVLRSWVKYMATFGHELGVLTTYRYSWVLKHLGNGAFVMSPAVPWDAKSTERVVSVTEVSALHNAAAGTVLAVASLLQHQDEWASSMKN